MIGKTLGHYDVLETIGAGGMGCVYRARDRRLNRDVALKLLPDDLRGDETALARFEREARALAALNHPNIVTVYSIEMEKDQYFLTMELVRGRSLEGCVPDGGLPEEEFREIAGPLTDAVAAAHAAGIVHRDLKPSNIVVSDSGTVKVLDFGVARIPHAAPLTGADTTVGTIAYMSPEQVSGGEVSARSDVFSLGIVFYEMLSGARPFRGEFPAAILYSIVNEDAPRLVSAGDAVADLVDRCLAKDPAERFADAGALAKALKVAVTGVDMPAGGPAASGVPDAVREAYEQSDFETAYRELQARAVRRDLSAEELETLGACAFWLMDMEPCNRAWDRSVAAYVESGRNADAARVAVKLVYFHIEKSAPTVANGWLKRAERLLDDEPECVEHARLLRRQVANALLAADFDRALELNRRCAEIAERCDDPDLRVEALHDRGQILVGRGDVDDGMALVDEAMAAAVGDQLNSATAGNLYCRTLSLCRALADFDRVREWSDVAWRWTKTCSATGIRGICRIYSAETMRHQGLWEEAEQHVRRACDDFVANRQDNHAGEAYCELGELALRKGDFDEAEAAFFRALEMGHDPVPGLPLLRQAQGKGTSAVQSIGRALEEVSGDRLRRARLLTAAIPIFVGNDRLAEAENAAEELTRIAAEFGCPCFEAHALAGAGAVALERGDPGAATPVLREAWTVFKRNNFPYDAARAQTLLGRAYRQAGNEEDAALQLEAAKKVFCNLGAAPDVKTVSELLNG